MLIRSSYVHVFKMQEQTYSAVEDHLQYGNGEDNLPLTQVVAMDPNLQHGSDEESETLPLTQPYYATKPGSFVVGETVQVNYKGLDLYLDAHVIAIGKNKNDRSMLVRISGNDRHPNEEYTVENRFDKSRVISKRMMTKKNGRYSLRLTSRSTTVDDEEAPRRSARVSARPANRKV